MNNTDEIKACIENELGKREIPIRNKNAIDALLKALNPLNALSSLKQVLTGAEECLGLERQKLTLEKILELIIGIDAKLNGDSATKIDPSLKILVENIVASGDVVGLEGKTSNDAVKKIFEHSLDVTVKNVRSQGNVTGVKLDVDQEMEVKQQVNIDTDIAHVALNPSLGKIILGKRSNNSNIPKRIGILNKGKNNVFINNKFVGLDVGIQDDGEDTTAKGNDFR